MITLMESYGDADWKFVKSKSVLDSDGYETDYTLYKDSEGNFGCILGDNDVYNPENSYFDAEFDSEKEAIDWFNSYKGFEEE